MAQEATIAAPVAPGEDVAVEAVAQEATAAPVEAVQEQVAAPVEGGVIEGGVVEGSVMTGTYVSDPGMGVYQDAVPAPVYDGGAYGAVDTGCSSCGGGNVVAAPTQMYSVAPVQNFDAAPMMSAQPMMTSAPVSGCSSCGQVATAPVVAAPVSGCSSCGQVATAPVADCGCNSVAAPVADCGCNAAPTTACCNSGRNRGQVVRKVTTRGRSVLTRVRGRRNRCCN